MGTDEFYDFLETKLGMELIKEQDPLLVYCQQRGTCSQTSIKAYVRAHDDPNSTSKENLLSRDEYKRLMCYQKLFASAVIQCKLDRTAFKRDESFQLANTAAYNALVVNERCMRRGIEISLMTSSGKS